MKLKKYCLLCLLVGACFVYTGCSNDKKENVNVETNVDQEDETETNDGTDQEINEEDTEDIIFEEEDIIE